MRPAIELDFVLKESGVPRARLARAIDVGQIRGLLAREMAV